MVGVRIGMMVMSVRMIVRVIMVMRVVMMRVGMRGLVVKDGG